MKNKKNDPKTALIAFAVVFAISLIGNIAEEAGGEASGALVGLIVIIAITVLIFKKKKGKIKNRDESTVGIIPSSKPAVQPTVHTAAPVSGANFYNECDYGDYNCDFSHDYETRVKQLNDWLKNGIIDKGEYKVMLAKYKKNYEEHHN